MFKAKKATPKLKPATSKAGAMGTSVVNKGHKKLGFSTSTKTGIVGTPHGQKMLQKAVKAGNKSKKQPKVKKNTFTGKK